MRKFLYLVVGVAAALTYESIAHASALTVRDIKILGQGKIEIQLDGTATKDELQMEYVRDIVQFSIQNATIYPAKILHSDESSAAFSKVFAYQYSPNLVRVRFSVDGKAEQLQGKVKWEQKGKILTVTFPSGAIAKAPAKKEADTDHERSLLAKVLGRDKAEVKVEKIEDAQVKPETVKADDKAITAKSDIAKAEVAATDANDSESQPVLRGDKRTSTIAKLGGARNGPSPLRAFLAMFLVVGGLGLVLLYVKKKKGLIQAKKVGNSWVSNFLSGSKKQKALIEIIANHPLGPKQSITVVKIRGQQLVLGVTEGNVQLITQLDSDDEIDLLEDPKVADSIGKIFGGKPSLAPVQTGQALLQPSARVAQGSGPDILGASFGNLLKNSTGAGAIVARNAYQSQNPVAAQRAQIQNQQTQPASAQSSAQSSGQSSVRDQIKQRLQGMRN